MTRGLLLAGGAIAALAFGGTASAQGIALFGDARLGLGYNINNDGSVNGDDDLRAVSRVRFGVNMTGETDSGITFGATIRADNSVAGQGGAVGQRAGSVFVSGGWGTLTFGDTNGADEQWVGDVPGNLSLTGLGDLQETIFISNGGDFGNEEGNSFAANPFARPTIRYDFDLAGFGLSLSSNRDLTDIGVGGGYAADFAGGSWSVGAGYYKFESFVDVGGDQGEGLRACVTDLGVVDVPPGATCAELGGTSVLFPGEAGDLDVPAGKQWSAGLHGDYENFGLGVVYTSIESDDDDASNLDILYLGGTFGWEAFTLGGYYANILNGEGEVADADGRDSYGVSAQYDLGGGASVNGGVGRTFGGGDGGDGATVADFGVRMAF
jgi:outer membrane protein OmpU